MRNETRYVVSLRFAYDSQDGHCHGYVLDTFASKADALHAAAQALLTYRCTFARISRERFIEAQDRLTGEALEYWQEDAEVRKTSRYLLLDERLEAVA